jgi:hypothetical protein
MSGIYQGPDRGVALGADDLRALSAAYPPWAVAATEIARTICHFELGIYPVGCTVGSSRPFRQFARAQVAIERVGRSVSSMQQRRRLRRVLRLLKRVDRALSQRAPGACGATLRERVATLRARIEALRAGMGSPL